MFLNDPFFKKLISQKSKFLPLTDDRMTRFWISLNQGVDFVFSSIYLMEGREVFIPKIPSMKIKIKNNFSLITAKFTE